MNNNYTHVSILLDASGSMYSIKNDIIGGFNNLLIEQKKDPGKLTMTVSQFSSSYDYKVINAMSEVNSVIELTQENYRTSGGTALLDGIGKIISETGKALSLLPEDERPGKVLITIISDGEENDSKEETKESIAELINHQKEKYNWQFSYIGANQDSITTGASFGINTNTVNYSADVDGTRKLFAGMSKSVSYFRSAVSSDSVTSSYNLSQDDIDNA